MARRLAGLGTGVAVLGVVAALAARLSLPGTLLRFGFQSDPANIVLVSALVLTALLLIGAALAHGQAQRSRREYAQELAAHETERRRFIHRLDHELKNPLTAIQVQLDNLQAAQSESEPAVAAVHDVRTQVGRLTHLTRGLRRLADLETRALEVEPVEIGELLEEVAELLECPDRIQLEVQRVPWPIPAISADRELLLMVFRNLVDNALKYSSALVQVRARQSAGQLTVEVIDTGRGIPPDELPLVAGELYRGSNARDVGGSGLGLAMVQRIIERHGGRLDLRSRLSQGTIATVQLPYDQPTQAASQPA